VRDLFIHNPGCYLVTQMGSHFLFGTHSKGSVHLDCDGQAKSAFLNLEFSGELNSTSAQNAEFARLEASWLC
jgi:hypothetical protein